MANKGYKHQDKQPGKSNKPDTSANDAGPKQGGPGGSREWYKVGQNPVHKDSSRQDGPGGHPTPPHGSYDTSNLADYQGNMQSVSKYLGSDPPPVVADIKPGENVATGYMGHSSRGDQGGDQRIWPEREVLSDKLDEQMPDPRNAGISRPDTTTLSSSGALNLHPFQEFLPVRTPVREIEFTEQNGAVKYVETGGNQ